MQKEKWKLQEWKRTTRKLDLKMKLNTTKQ